MVATTSSPRFSAKIQTSPDGRSSGSLRSVACAALCPWNTATRLHDVLPPRSLHCRIVPLSFTLRRAAALAAGLAGSAEATHGAEPAMAAPGRNSRANRRIEEKARMTTAPAQPNADAKGLVALDLRSNSAFQTGVQYPVQLGCSVCAVRQLISMCS